MGRWQNLRGWPVSEPRHFQTQDCPLMKGTALFLGNHIEKNICKFYWTCYWGKMVILPPAVPTRLNALFLQEKKVCKITLSTWTPAWGLEGLFRSPRAKLYVTALFPLAWVVGKTNWYFHSESNCLKNNVSPYCSQSARNWNTWSSKLFGWPCQLSNILSSKQKHVRQDIRKENQTHTCTFMELSCVPVIPLHFFFFKASQMLDTNHANHLTLCTGVFSMWILGLKATHWKR